MNDCIKPFRMSCSVSPECIRGLHEPVWTPSADGADFMGDVVFWDGEARRFLRRERRMERCAGVFSMLAPVLLLAGFVLLAALALLVAGVFAGLAGRAWMDASAALDFRDWTYRGLGE